MDLGQLGIPVGERVGFDVRAWSLFGALAFGTACGGQGAGDDGGTDDPETGSESTGGPECVSNADCGTDELCYEGMCVGYSADDGGEGYYWDCESDADCNQFETCVEHVCEGGPPKLPSCASAPTWGNEIPLPEGSDHLATAITFVDADENPEQDLALAGPDGVTVIAGPGGQEPVLVSPGLGAVADFIDLFAGDVDLDGHEDLVFINDVTGGEIHVAFGDGLGAFTPGPITGAVGVGAAAALGEFDGNAPPDLALALVGGVQIFAGDGTGAFAAGVVVQAPADTPLAAGDIAGDGRDELLARANASGVLAWWDTVAVQSTVLDDALLTSLPTAFALFDFDGQPGAELLRLDPFDGDALVTWWPNTGAGLGDASPHISPYALNSMAHGDFDGDGDTDVAAGTTAGELFVLYNDPEEAPGCYSPHPVVGTSVRAAGDLDGDGRDEVIVHDGTELVVLGVQP